MKTTLQSLLTALCLILLAGCGGSDASRITKVLNQCAQVAARSAQIPGGPAAQADFTAREFQRIDVTGCPPDFRMAYQAHVFAWQQSVSSLANNNLGTAFLEGVVSSLADDPRYMGAAGQQAAFAGQQVNATYFELTQIAARYGARIPQAVVGR